MPAERAGSDARFAFQRDLTERGWENKARTETRLRQTFRICGAQAAARRNGMLLTVLLCDAKIKN